ncbi:zf-TFIIB domain-containing protein [Shimia sp. SDUM112013]|uniref:TFIIB-type zinc ribbon-containing protein n=1 Tax=Shimia sp. SDUM112013 TaxID=3136160 RepID=UPI0032EEF5A3
MKCPIDGTPLVITDRSGVEIDYCPQCRGVWLDRGELDKIIERSADFAAPPPPPREHREPAREAYRDDYRDSYKGKSRKKKKMGGFLEDIFDF